MNPFCYSNNPIANTQMQSTIEIPVYFPTKDNNDSIFETTIKSIQ